MKEGVIPPNHDDVPSAQTPPLPSGGGELNVVTLPKIWTFLSAISALQ
jgi:hypothetical protein